MMPLKYSVLQTHWKNGKVTDRADKNIINTEIAKVYNMVALELRQLELDGSVYRLSTEEIKRRLWVWGDKNSAYTVQKHFEEFIRSKRKDSTKETYKYTAIKIESFAGGRDLLFSDITVLWLKDFERFMQDQGLSVNYINMNFRNLRAVFNDAINCDRIDQNLYPFRKFKLRTERTKKRSLSVDQLRTFRDHQCEPHEEKYRDIFMLIFYLVGINITDLLHLTDITADGRVEYRRAKTNRLYSVAIPKEAMTIIEKYRGKKYLLNFLDDGRDYKNFFRQLNKALKQIGEVKRTGFGGKKVRQAMLPYLSTYWARHTWATIAAGLDIPKETIAAALGHGGDSVTDIYIDFDRKKVDQANREVLEFVS